MSDPLNRARCAMKLQAMFAEGFVKSFGVVSWNSRKVTQA